MKEEKDKLRDLMQKVFDDYVEAPDSEDWIRIEKSLQKIKGRRYIMWAIWSAAASLLLLIALYTGGILNHVDNAAVKVAINHSKQNNQSVTSTANANLTEKIIKKTGTEKERQLPTNQSVKKFRQIPIKTLSTHNQLVNNNASASNLEKATISQSKTHNKTTITVKEIQKFKNSDANKMLLATEQFNRLLSEKSSKNIKPILSTQPTDSMNRYYTSNSFVHAIRPKSIGSISHNTSSKQDKSKDFKNILPDNTLLTENKKAELSNHVSSMRFNGLSLSNSSGFQMQTSSEVLSYSGAFASQLTSKMYLTSVKKFDVASQSSPNIGDLFQNKKRDFTPPLTFGLNINFVLQGKWSIETGIQYTNLRSKGEVSIGSSNEVQFVTINKYKVNESLHYLGVPLIVNYMLFQKRKTKFYVSTGFSIEKGINAKYEAISADNIPGILPIYSHNSIEGLQYSVNSGIGIGYKFIKHFELFAQPSVTYYFNLRGKNTTIYTEHPWLFNMRSGIRYSIK